MNNRHEFYIQMMNNNFSIILFTIALLFISNKGVSQSKDPNYYKPWQKMLHDEESGLKSSIVDDYDYRYAERNSHAIINALNNLGADKEIVLPEGLFYVNTLLIPKFQDGLTISGAGIGKTILKRAGFAWDNNTQGDCPLRTEIITTEHQNDITFTNLTLDGNCHHIAISGYGRWDCEGRFFDGLPQFPTFISTDPYARSASSVININSSNNIVFENVEFLNGYRWCIALGMNNGISIRNCIINTGNISTEFRGHLDAPPHNTVMHMHTSQDGVHFVNCSNVIIEYNDIHSEDSAIAIEYSPNWKGRVSVVENYTINNNYISTLSPSDGNILMNDDDIIYGTGLADKWVGQSAVDIFYNADFDTARAVVSDGKQFFRNITVSENAIEGVRHGVRCGFFQGGGVVETYKHRIYGLTIQHHHPSFTAGRDRDKPAGIRRVLKNRLPGYNLTGGAAVAIKFTDSVLIDNNLIDDCSGGLGIYIENVTRFTITNNSIHNISGTDLGDPALNYVWEGGEGIRIDNTKLVMDDPNVKENCFDAGTFLVTNNRIGKVETSKIAVLFTSNGVIDVLRNYDHNGVSLAHLADGVFKKNSVKINWGEVE